MSIAVAQINKDVPVSAASPPIRKVCSWLPYFAPHYCFPFGMPCLEGHIPPSFCSCFCVCIYSIFTLYAHSICTFFAAFCQYFWKGNGPQISLILLQWVFFWSKEFNFQRQFLCPRNWLNGFLWWFQCVLFAVHLWSTTHFPCSMVKQGRQNSPSLMSASGKGLPGWRQNRRPPFFLKEILVSDPFICRRNQPSINDQP